MQSYIEQFVANSSKMTAVGAVGLIVTALLVISSVDGALNHIWRSRTQRPIVYSFAIYWMVLTLGPILVGASMAISTYLLSIRWLAMTGVYSLVDQVLRIFLSCSPAPVSGSFTASCPRSEFPPEMR